MTEKVSSVLYGFIFISLAIAGIGSFYYAGAVKYGVVDPFNYASYNRSQEISNNITNSLTTLTGGSIDFGSGVGLYLTSAAQVVYNFVSGEYLRIGIDIMMDMTGMSGVTIPVWLTTGGAMLLTLVFLFSVAGILIGRDV